MSSAEWTLTVQDFRGLRNVRWSPSGVCLLSGPNGAGKSSILDALEFMHGAALRGVLEAVRLAGGGAFLRRRGAEPEAPVRLELALGELSWEIQIPVEGGAIDPNYGEVVKYRDRIIGKRVMHAKDVLLRKTRPGWYNPTKKTVTVKDPWDMGDDYVVAPGEWAHFPDQWAQYQGEHDDMIPKIAPQLNKWAQWTADERSVLQMLWDMLRLEEVEPLINLSRAIRVHASCSLDRVRELQSGADTDADLHPRGNNLWNVLRNWRSSPRRFRGQFQWVLDALKDAFPDLVVDLEFDSIGQSIIGRFYPPGAQGPDDGLPLSLAADGMLAGLLHLTAVAGAKEGSILAIDEMDNYLHPHAIRSILKSMRELADERDLTILLTTHSPVVMNEFKGRERQFYVLEAGRDVLPIPLDEAQDPDWLAHFSLGDLYDREEFGAPVHHPHAAE